MGDKNNNKNNKKQFKHAVNKIYASNGKKKDYFGYSVSIYGDNLVVGSYAASPVVAYSGAVYLYHKNYSTTTNSTVWKEIGTVVATEALQHDNFGGSVAIWKDTILVGSYQDDVSGTSAGSAYIFKISDNKWFQKQRLVADDGSAGDFFGYSVSISEDVAIIGAHGWAVRGNLVGAAYIYRQNKDQYWSLESKIVPTDSQEFQMFSYSVAVQQSVSLIGAYGDRSYGTNAGAAYIFTPVTSTVIINETSYDVIEWQQTAKLLANDLVANSYFGISVAIDCTTETTSSVYNAVVGAYMANGEYEATGAAYVYRGIKGASFDRGPYSWTQVSKLVAADGESNDLFGTSVSVYRKIILIGSKGDNIRGIGSGSAYFFTASDVRGGWSFQSKIWSNDSVAYDDFGVSVAVWGDVAIVGADQGYGYVEAAGCAYIFRPSEFSQPYQISNLTSMSQLRFLLLLTIIPFALLSIPAVICFGLWYLQRRKFIARDNLSVSQRSSLPMGSDSSHSSSSLPSDYSRYARSVIATRSQHGLIIGQKAVIDRMELRDHSGNRLHGVVMTTSGGTISPMVVDHQRYPNFNASKQQQQSMNTALFT